MSAKLTNAEYLRKLRAEAVEKGLCYVCRCRPHRTPTSRYCEDCYQRARANERKNYHALKAASFCTKCKSAPAGDGHVCCDACRLDENRKKLESRVRVRQQGICDRCRKRPLVEGRTQCEPCLLDNCDRAAEWRLRMATERGEDWLRRYDRKRNAR